MISESALVLAGLAAGATALISKALFGNKNGKNRAGENHSFANTPEICGEFTKEKVRAVHTKNLLAL